MGVKATCGKILILYQNYLSQRHLGSLFILDDVHRRKKMFIVFVTIIKLILIVIQIEPVLNLQE